MPPLTGTTSCRWRAGRGDARGSAGWPRTDDGRRVGPAAAGWGGGRRQEVGVDASSNSYGRRPPAGAQGPDLKRGMAAVVLGHSQGDGGVGGRRGWRRRCGS